jgi:transposase
MELHVLHQHGWSIIALAREFGLNWRTVKREVTSPGPRAYPTRAEPTALTEVQLRHVERRLAVCPTLRGTDLHAELCRDYDYTGSYPAFARKLRRLRPPRIREPLVRFETDPGMQTQADWAQLGVWPLHDGVTELSALVAILGCSRAPAIHFATDRTRATTFTCLVRCLDDLGGTTREILTDRDPAFCIGATGDGRAILAPEWVDLAALLGVVPKACRPYRAQTKGKVERMVRELKESFLPWLSGQILPAQPTLADYDALARRWISEVVLLRRHRTTGHVVGEAWAKEQAELTPIPMRILAGAPAGAIPARPAVNVIDLAARRAGEQVQIRELADYDAAVDDAVVATPGAAVAW